MAVRKEIFADARIGESWKNTVSDDYELAKAVHRAGLKIAYAPGALVPSYDRATARQCLSWMRRQLMLTRRYSPRLWWMAFAAHVFYCGGMAASVLAAARGSRLAEWALIAQLSPGMLKGLNRATLAKAALPECEAWFRRHQWVHAMWIPLATWLWLATLAASALGNTIEWRGRKYSL
jgi:cellulose synthase/poly-beta-1,6-N-acetylglucosamine synthase-like glycosyltransferase